MDGKRWRMLLQHRHNTQVAYDGGIGAGGFHGARVGGQRLQVLIVRVGVAGNVYPRAGIMRQRHGTWQVFQGKVGGTRPQAEAVARKVHCIGAEMQRIAKLLPPTSGCEQLGLVVRFGLRHA